MNNCDSDSVEVDSDDNVSELTDSTTTEISVRKSRKKKTNSQKCKEYRERKKLGNVRYQKKRSDEYCDENQLKKPKTDAQRSKEYRERQKIKRQTESQQKNTNHVKRKSTRTPAEYMREYRCKVKLKNQVIQLNDALKRDPSASIMYAALMLKYAIHLRRL